MHSPLPHSNLAEVLPDVFMVTGTNITTHEGVELQHSRNMVVVRNEGELTLINTVRLSEQGLAQLKALGNVKHIVRIGAFHGRDDAFYLERFSAQYWILEGMEPKPTPSSSVEILSVNTMPFPSMSLFVFETAQFPEGILHLDKEGGILITCDSIKNWVSGDEYFSDATVDLYKKLDFFGKASISKVWQDACQVHTSDIERLKQLKYEHLLSAHGEALLHEAKEKVGASLEQVYGC